MSVETKVAVKIARLGESTMETEVAPGTTLRDHMGSNIEGFSAMLDSGAAIDGDYVLQNNDMVVMVPDIKAG